MNDPEGRHERPRDPEPPEEEGTLHKGARRVVDAPEAGPHGAARSHLGRPSSWAVVVVMIVGFTLAGLSLTMGPSWILLAVGTVLFVGGGIAGYALGIQKDTGVAEGERGRRQRRSSS